MSDLPIDVEKIHPLISAQDIGARVTGMARDIARELPNDMLVIALLRGSFMFTADLLRALHNANARPQVDFLTLASYHDAKESSGTVEIVRDLQGSVEGR